MAAGEGHLGSRFEKLSWASPIVFGPRTLVRTWGTREDPWDPRVDPSAATSLRARPVVSHICQNRADMGHPAFVAWDRVTGGEQLVRSDFTLCHPRETTCLRQVKGGNERSRSKLPFSKVLSFSNLPLSNRSSRKHRPPLCHLDRSEAQWRDLCVDTLSWKCFSTGSPEGGGVKRFAVLSSV
jgi:hypothetical protein